MAARKKAKTKFERKADKCKLREFNECPRCSGCHICAHDDRYGDECVEDTCPTELRHYDAEPITSPHSKAACGAKVPTSKILYDGDLVTCGRCKATRIFSKQWGD